jgi:hypothetical protein
MRTKEKKLQKVVNMAVVRTSDRVTDERGTIIEHRTADSWKHKARRGVLGTSLIMVRSWVVLMDKGG